MCTALDPRSVAHLQIASLRYTCVAGLTPDAESLQRLVYSEHVVRARHASQVRPFLMSQFR